MSVMAVSGAMSTGALADTSGRISLADLTGQEAVLGLIDNAAFLPGDGAQSAHHDFTGSIAFGEAEMGTDPAVFAAAEVMGKNPQIFPAVTLAFFTWDGDLVPVARDVIRSGSTPDGASYWDVIVQPGRVWSEPQDGEWSRASFPFALVHSIEGESHNGVATFLYSDDAVSDLRFQIVQQTAPFYIEDYFTAWGRAPARLIQGGIADLERDIITRSEVALLFDDDCFRFEIGFRRDNTRVRPTGPSEGVFVRLNLATFGGTGYGRSDGR
jgi:hypothetical protein